MSTKVPALKNIPTKVDRELADTLKSMKEAQEIRLGRLGDPLDRAITLRELIDSGMAKKLTNKPFDPNGTTPEFIPNDDAIGDLSIPPAPTGLEASGAFTEIIINWNTAPYTNHAYTEVWRSRDDEVGTATLITTTSAFVTTDPVGYNQTYFYWVRFVSTSDVRGPFNQTNGTKADTVEDIAEVMTQLSQTLADLPGYNLLATGTTAATIIKSSGEPSTRTNGDALQPNDIWFDTDDGQIYIRNASNNAWVAGRDSTLVNLFGATSFTGSTLTAAMATAQSDVVTLTTANTARATEITNLSATVGGHTSSISTLNTTTASHTGDLNAMFVLQVSTESNGSKSAAGMVIGSNASNGSGAQSYVQFQADKFAIWSGSTNVAPFIVSGGTVFIDSARIQDGAITNARIADATIESGKIVSLVANKIVSGTMSADRISGGVIQSTDLSTGGATTIHGANITTGTISASVIDTAIIRATDLSTNTSTVIHGGNITTGTISATRIDTANLTLPSSGAAAQTIGPWTPSNTMQYKFVTSVGSGAGFYHGFVRLQGITNHVKTVSLVYFDASTSAIIYNSGTTDKLPGQVDRFFSSSDSANIPQAFEYTGSNTVNLFILAQADSAPDSLTVTARFYKYST
jgi:hypothetical protein